MKPYFSRKVLRGDVIRSPLFEFGSVNTYTGAVHVGYTSAKVLEDGTISGKLAPDSEAEAKARDQTRATALYVVVKAREVNNGFGHGPGDQLPSGWEVEAQRLTSDGNYDPEGETIAFSQHQGCHDYIEYVQVVGKMNRVVDYQWASKFDS